MFVVAELADRGVVVVSGPDRQTFLQGLITNDIRKADDKKPIFAALLSAQGKYLHDFFIVAKGDEYWLDVEKIHLTELVTRLTQYKLRSAVRIEDRSATYRVFAAWSEPHEPSAAVAVLGQGVVYAVDGMLYPDPRLPQLGQRGFIKTHAPIGILTKHDRVVEYKQYDLHRLTLGVPDSSKDMIPDKSILLECGYDELNGIDFNKGCYVGQEVTARSKHRGTLHKFMYRVSTPGLTLPPFGSVITFEGREIGEMRSSQGNAGLAMLRIDEVKKARSNNKNIVFSEQIISAQLPFWASR